MKISLNWLNDYVKVKDQDPKVLADLITKSGINIEGIRSYHIPSLIVGKVKHCEMHPDSDHLHVCQVDLGTSCVQIVCGAPNVQQDAKVIVAQIGTVLPGDFVIKKSVIRGVESNGMLCALSELGLEDSKANYHKGIYILPTDAVVGSDPFVYLGLDDVVYELDLNPNRNDCLSHLGFAYQTAAVLDRPVMLPETLSHPVSESVLDHLQVEVKTENCKMYRARKVCNVSIKESPDFMKQRLLSAGMRPINNVVDISNYIMLEYGQPLHFFDADRLGEKIVVRMAEEGEELVTLDQKVRLLTEKDIVITDGAKPVAIAGVMGGLDTEVVPETKNIIIESAMFDPYLVRYTSIRLDLRSEASMREEKGLNYEYCEEALNRACYLLEKYASATVFQDEVVYDAVDKKPKVATVRLEHINRILGMELKSQDVEDVFRRLVFPYEKTGESYTVVIPNRRMDVAIREDLIEEVGSLYGYDAITAKLPRLSLKAGSYNPNAAFRKGVSRFLRSYGLDEVRTYTLVSLEDADLFSYQSHSKVVLNRPMSNDKSVVRQSLVPSLLHVLDYNSKRHTSSVSIYEIANTYCVEDDYAETMKLGFLYQGTYLENRVQQQRVPYDFYTTKGMVASLLDYLGYHGRYRFEVTDSIPEQMHPGVSCEIFIDRDPIGYFGQLHPRFSKEKVYVGEIDLTKLQQKKVRALKYQEISKYPSISKDVAFLVEKEVTAQSLMDTMYHAGGKLLKQIEVFDLYIKDPAVSREKSLAFSLLFEDPTKTLTEEEVAVVFHKIIETVTVKHQAVLRDK